MSEVDEGTHVIEVHVIVMGSATQTFLDNLANAEREQDGVRMRLGAVQGWTPTFHFHGFGHEPWAGDGAEGERLESIVPRMDALVLTDGDGHGYSSNAVERLARVLKPAKIGVPTGVFGSAVLAQEWSTQANRPPVGQLDSEPHHAMGVMKAVAKAVLKAMQSAK